MQGVQAEPTPDIAGLAAPVADGGRERHLSYFTAKMLGQTEKVCLRFGIIEGKGYELHQHHTVAQLYDDPGPKGRFKPKGRTCKLMVEFARAFRTRKSSDWTGSRVFVVSRPMCPRNHRFTSCPLHSWRPA